MSTKAVRTAIALQKLDPNLPHCKTNKSGQLVSLAPVAVVAKPKVEKKPVVEVVAPPVAPVEEPVVSSESTEVLVEESVPVVVEPVAEVNEEKKPTKKESKKKPVSTDL